MKLLKLFVLSGLAIPTIAFADAGLPKRAMILTDISQPPVEASLTEIRLKLFEGKCEKSSNLKWMSDVDLGQDVIITINQETYQADIKGATVMFRTGAETCDLTVDNITNIEFNARHSSLKDATIRVTLDLKNRKIKFDRSKFWQGSAGLGEFVEVY